MSSAPEPRRTIVTGGASGLGAAIAARCTGAGHEVVIIDRQPAPGNLVLADLADVDEARDAVREAVRRLGGGLDNLVLSAGINAPALMADAYPHTVASIVQVNLIGTMVAAGAGIPDLMRSSGRLVVIGSTLSRRSNPGQAAYAASKFGIAGFVETLGQELRGAVGVTLVSPGAMDTTLFAHRAPEWLPDPEAMMPPSAVAAAVLFALEQPPGVSVRELVITHTNAPDWP